MTKREREKWESELKDIARRANEKAVRLCMEISLPLEIEALKVMRNQINATIEAKEYLLDNFTEK